MTRLFHVSDIHFGAEDRDALAWFRRCVVEERPDAIIMTGDLTMRARAHEFAAAADWLAELDRPMTVEVGNHDLPAFNPLKRLLRPYARYGKVERALERPLEIAGIAVVPLRTTARFQWRWNWSKGHVGRRQLAKTVEGIAAAPADDLVIVACHHPLIEAGTLSTGRTRRGDAALKAIAEAGADIVLSGHVHDPFDIMYEGDGCRIRMIGAGTLSVRTRKSPAAFNELVIEGGEVTLKVRTLSPEGVAT